MAQKFKIGQRVRFIGGQEENYHPDFLAIMGLECEVIDYAENVSKWKYDIARKGEIYSVQESEIVGA